MKASLWRKECVNTIPGFFSLDNATNPYRLLDIEGAPPEQMLMDDFHGKT
jgi:hypothetical protein